MLVIPSEDEIILETIASEKYYMFKCVYNLSVYGWLLNFNLTFSKYLRNFAGHCKI